MTLQDEARQFAADHCGVGSTPHRLLNALADALDAAEAENKRLRSAIGRIYYLAAHPDKSHAETESAIRNEARAALGETK